MTDPATTRAHQVADAATALLEAIKLGADSITLKEARMIHSTIREAEGYLQSCRSLLEPPGVL